jgi:hypothetical protein
MLAAPLLRFFERVAKTEWEAWLKEWLRPLEERARDMADERMRGGLLLQIWDSRNGWMLDCGPLDPFRWGFYWRFWAGRTGIVVEYKARIDGEFAKFEKFRDSPTGGWAITPQFMGRFLVPFLDGVYACVDYSNWDHARVPANRSELAAWQAERAATRRPIKDPNLYGPSRPGLGERPGR